MTQNEVTATLRVPPEKPNPGPPPKPPVNRVLCFGGLLLAIAGIVTLIAFLACLPMDLLPLPGALLLIVGPVAAMAGASLLAYSLRGYPIAAALLFVGIMMLAAVLMIVDVAATFVWMGRKVDQYHQPDWPEFDKIEFPTPPEITMPEIHFPTEDSPPPAQILEPPDLPGVDVRLEIPAYAAEDLAWLPMAGRGGQQPASDQAPPRSVLVGLRIIQGTGWGGALRAVQPVYQVEGEHRYGERLGRTGQETSQSLVIARPGHAVAAVSVRSGAAINAMRVRFAPFSDGRLAVEEAYWSNWVGRAGGREMELDTDGWPVVGIAVQHADTLLGVNLQHVFPLGAPEESIPPLTTTSTAFTASAGGAGGTAYRDSAPAGGVLVGMRVTSGPNWGGVVSSLQPVYQRDDAYHLGQLMGTSRSPLQQWLARPGYAVGAIEVRRGLVINAVRLIYYRRTASGLDTGDSYASDWLGVASGNATRLEGNGQHLVGLSGGWSNDIISLAAEVAVAE